MKNPSWLTVELILCLEAYQRIQPQTPDPKLPEIRQLSDILGRLADKLGIDKADNYRSPASVVMKMMNFRSIDPAYAGAGLQACAQNDRLIWDEYADKPEILRELARIFKSGIESI